MSELDAILQEIQERLRRNEHYLRQINRFHSTYQYDTYQKLYQLLNRARQLTQDPRRVER